MPKKKTEWNSTEENPEIEIAAEPEETIAESRPQYRDPTPEQAREVVRRLSPDGVIILQRALDARSRNRIGRDRSGKRFQ